MNKADLFKNVADSIALFKNIPDTNTAEQKRVVGEIEKHWAALADTVAPGGKLEERKSKLAVVKNEKGEVTGWTLEIPISIEKAEQRVVVGIVYEPDVVDSQGDFADADEIEKACHDFMMRKGQLGIMHKEAAGERASIVECYITRSTHVVGNQIVRKGTWVIAVKVHDDVLWADVKEGRLTGFSMGGIAEVDAA